MSSVRAAALCGLLAAAPATVCAQADPSSLCRAAISAAELGTRIPDEFLSAIGRVESGRPVPAGGLAPWPWTVNALGQGHFYASEAEAVAAVQQWQQAGVRSIDVGCLQVNLAQHPEAFPSLNAAFDPGQNAAYAARFLQTLFAQTGSWPRAAAAYHSQTPDIGLDYQKKVLAEWAVPDRPGFAPPLPDHRPGKPATTAVSAAPSPVAAMPGATGFARILRLPSAVAGLGTGRSLAAYRLMPVRVASVLKPH